VDSGSKMERNLAMDALMSGDDTLTLLVVPASARGRVMRERRMVGFIVGDKLVVGCNFSVLLKAFHDVTVNRDSSCLLYPFT
jgi:hypothetical protein